MAIITKITTQQKNQDRFNVFMDYGKGEEFAFSVDSDVLIKFQLKKGMELDDFSFLELQYQDDIRKAYHQVIHYLAKRMRSEKEIRDFLTKKEVDDPIVNEVLHKLATQKYINDEEYAHAFVRTQVNTSDKGPDLIRMELKEKGIKEDLARKALKAFPFEHQLEKATTLSKKFFEKNKKDSERIVKQKLEGMLLRKGYPLDIIQMGINESKPDKDSDAEMEAVRYQGEKIDRKYGHLSGFEYDQKMKQSLYRKGFTIDLIEKFLAEKEES